MLRKLRPGGGDIRPADSALCALLRSRPLTFAGGKCRKGRVPTVPIDARLDLVPGKRLFLHSDFGAIFHQKLQACDPFSLKVCFGALLEVTAEQIRSPLPEIGVLVPRQGAVTVQSLTPVKPLSPCNGDKGRPPRGGQAEDARSELGSVPPRLTGWRGRESFRMNQGCLQGP